MARKKSTSDQLSTVITCPSCGKEIPLDKALTSNIESKIKSQFESELIETENKYKKQLKEKEKMLKSVQEEANEKLEEALKEERKKIEKDVKKKAEESISKELRDLKEQIKEKSEKLDKAEKDELNLRKEKRELEESKKKFEIEMQRKLDEERKKISEDAFKKAEELTSKELKDLQEQIKEKSERLQKAEEKELQLRKEKRELDEAKEKFELEMQRKLDEERKKILEDAFKKAEENHELKDKEKQKIIDDLKNEIQELQKKSQQGSQKLQGEVLEEELENVLEDTFKNDEIKPISSGIKGADVLQMVFASAGNCCGKILFESKNAKNWSNGWISKLKKDMLEEKADIGVIVTTVLPDEIETFGIIDKVVVVHYRLVIPVANMLRNQLLEVSRTKSYNVGKNEKMEALYNYLTSTEFRQRIESIGGAFKDMMEDLQREKRAMMKQWSKREKQIEQVFNGLGSMYGSMQGLVGSSLQDIKLLEIHESSEEDSSLDDDALEDVPLFKKHRRK